MKLVVFDDGLGSWGPLTDLHAIFELRSGAVTTLERLERAIGAAPVSLWAPAELTPLLSLRHPLPLNELPDAPPADAEEPVMLVNGRYLGVADVEQVRGMSGHAVLTQPDGQVVAVNVSLAAARRVLTAMLQGPAALVAMCERLGLQQRKLGQNLLIERPWHILAQLPATLKADLAATTILPLAALPEHVARMGNFGIHVATDACLDPMVVLNAQTGPIVIDHRAIVKSFSVLQGPCYVGPGSTIVTHTLLGPNSVVGPVCIIGGEVSSSIISGYTNKAHTGYLGNSLVGQWNNLGAGTTVSNLKNTYGTVRMQLAASAQSQETGELKLGPVLGDFVRTGIGCRLNTGACVGTGAMLALSGISPKYVGRFSFCVDQGSERCDLEKLIATAAKMKSRRGQTLAPAEQQRLRDLWHRYALG